MMPSDSASTSGRSSDGAAGSAVHANGGAASEITAKPVKRPTVESDPGVLGQSVPDRFTVPVKKKFIPGEEVEFTYHVDSSDGEDPIPEVGLLLGTKSGLELFEKCLVRQSNVGPVPEDCKIIAMVSKKATTGKHEVLAALYPAKSNGLLSFVIEVA